MDPKIKQSWENFLNPDVMRPRLISASIYIAIFEILKDTIIGRIRDFFCHGFDESGDKIDPKYESDVLSRKKKPIYASLDWLKERKAVNDEDLAIFESVKKCRNVLAHELLSTLGSDGLPPEFDMRLGELVGLLNKIEVWWIIYVEIPLNPDIDESKVDKDGIVPGPLITVKLLLEIALGDEEKSRYYFEEFRKQSKS